MTAVDENPRSRFNGVQRASVADSTPGLSTPTARPAREAASGLGVWLVMLVLFLGELGLTTGAAQLSGLGGWQLLLFAVGVTAALFAGARTVAHGLHEAARGSEVRRHWISVAVTTSTFIALLLTASMLATLREAYALSVFAGPAQDLEIDKSALVAVGRVGITLLVIVIGLDYATPSLPPLNWARLASALRSASAARAERRRRRQERRAVRAARRRRDALARELQAVRQRGTDVRVRLADLAAALEQVISDAELADVQQTAANAAVSQDAHRRVARAFVPWPRRLLARLRGVQGMPTVALPWPQVDPSNRTDVLAQARRVAAPAVDVLRDLQVVTPHGAERLSEAQRAPDPQTY